jgi:hypothetical protein
MQAGCRGCACVRCCVSAVQLHAGQHCMGVVRLATGSSVRGVCREPVVGCAARPRQHCCCISVAQCCRLTMSTTCFVCSSKLMQFLKPASRSRSLRGRTWQQRKGRSGQASVRACAAAGCAGWCCCRCCMAPACGQLLIRRTVLAEAVKQASKWCCRHAAEASPRSNCASSHTHPDANLDAIQAAVVRHGVFMSIYVAEGPGADS